MFKMAENKIGKNDNQDIGNNKNNKSIVKQINKNNISYNPNKVIVDLIEKIALIEVKIAKDIDILKECKDCINIINPEINVIKSKIEKMDEDFDMEKQILSLSPIIYNVSEIRSRYIKDISNLQTFNFNNDFCCSTHKWHLKEINSNWVEVTSLKTSLTSLKN